VSFQLEDKNLGFEARRAQSSRRPLAIGKFRKGARPRAARESGKERRGGSGIRGTV